MNVYFFQYFLIYLEQVVFCDIEMTSSGKYLPKVVPQTKANYDQNNQHSAKKNFTHGTNTTSFCYVCNIISF